jgi:hypothetical protein
MTYDVTWEPRADDRLAEIWLVAADRESVTRAAFELDGILALRPLRFGESRSSSVHRTAFAPPLGIEYTVIEDDKKVTVLSVWSIE